MVDAHGITDQAEAALQDQPNNQHIVVRVEPC
jgi:hypothetical protein